MNIVLIFAITSIFIMSNSTWASDENRAHNFYTRASFWLPANNYLKSELEYQATIERVRLDPRIAPNLRYSDFIEDGKVHPAFDFFSKNSSLSSTLSIGDTNWSVEYVDYLTKPYGTPNFILAYEFCKKAEIATPEITAYMLLPTRVSIEHRIYKLTRTARSDDQKLTQFGSSSNLSQYLIECTYMAKLAHGNMWVKLSRTDRYLSELGVYAMYMRSESLRLGDKLGY